MRKSLQIRILFILLLLAAALAGCGRQDQSAETPPSGQLEPTQPGGQTTGSENQDEASLISLPDMLGKHDSEVKDLYGGGTENRTEDESILLGRSYETTLHAKTAQIETVYSEESTVVSLSVFFSDMTSAELKDLLIDAYGQPSTSDETEAMDSKYLTWTRDAVSVSMNESYQMASAEFVLVEEQK